MEAVTPNNPSPDQDKNQGDDKEAARRKKYGWFRIKKSVARGLLIYLSFMTLISSIGLFAFAFGQEQLKDNLEVFQRSLLGAVVAGVLGSSIYYSRKLYQACISLDIYEPLGVHQTVRQMGIVFYFLLRPLYAAGLSIVACVVTKSGADFITNANDVNENFPYLVIVLCFFVGYSAGDLIDHLEIKGKKVVEGIFRSDERQTA